MSAYPDNALHTNAAWVAWRQGALALTSSDVVMHIEGHPWAASASELAWPLAYGAHPCQGALGATSEWLTLMAEQGVTVACLLPSQLALLCHQLAGQAFPPALRAVFCGGEALLCDVAETFLRSSTAALIHFHAHGVHAPVLWWCVNETDLRGKHVPLGRADANGLVSVADAAGRPVPVGVVGSLAMRTQLDAPFEATGDRARISRNGQLEMTASTDGSIWLRGHRVNPLDIERAILALPEVADCHVGVRISAALGAAVVAWVVPAAQQVRHALETCLAPMLKPSVIVVVRSLPLTRKGLVNVSALESLAIPDGLAQRTWQDRLALTSGASEVAVICTEAPLPVRAALRAPMRQLEQRAQVGTEASCPNATDVHEAHGPAMTPLAFDTLPAALRAAALAAPSRGVHFIDADGNVATLTYPALLDEAGRVSGGMRSLGWKAGDIVLLQLAAQDEFLIGFWACVLGGMVPVSIAAPPTYTEPNVTLSKILNVWTSLGHPGILAGSAEAGKLDGMADLRSQMRVAPIVSLRNSSTVRDVHHHAAADDMTLMLLTSGSTGTPKIVVHSHRALLSRCAATSAHRGYNELDVSFNWLPLDHVGALVMFHLRDVVLHCDQFHTRTEYVLADPLRWLAWIDRWRVTITWAPNFAFALVNAHASAIAQQCWDLSCLRVIINAGEAVVYRTAARFVDILLPFGLSPDTMKPEWGMSETSSAVTGADSLIEHHSKDGATFVDLGPPLAGTSLRIVDPQPGRGEGFAVGRLQVRGQSITLGYFQNDEANHEAFSADGWFDTGDLGFLRDGALTVVERAKDSVIVNGLNLYGHEIEAVVEEVAGVARSYTAACPYRCSNTDTDELVVFFVCEDDDAVVELTACVRATIGRHFGLVGVHLVPMLPAEIPKTAIGKIQRAQLRARFEAGDYDERVQALDEGHFPDDFARLDWCSAQRNPSAGRLPSGCFALIGGQASERKDLCCMFKTAGYDALVVNDGQEIALADVNYVVYLAPVAGNEPDAELARMIAALGDLVRAMSVLAPKRAAHLVLVSACGLDVELPQPLDCVNAALSAWLKSVALELPHITFRHIDHLPQALTAELVEELCSADREQVVAFRGSLRLVPRLARLARQDVSAEGLSFGHSGFWLLSGGLGGVGRLVAGHLAQSAGARLLIVGRRVHDEQVQAHLDALGQQGAKLMYASCDITDMAALQGAVDLAAAAWGCALAGIFQMAATGTLVEHWESLGKRGVLKDNAANTRAELSAKTTGSLNLIALLDGLDQQLPFIAFSSISASFGAGAMANYAAANAFLSALCSQRQKRGHGATFCLEWSMWDDIGLAAQVPAPLRERALAQGFAVIKPQQGLNALLYSLARTPICVMVGVADTHPAWRARGTAASVLGAEGLRAYIAPEHAVQSKQPAATPVLDVFGRPVPCRIVVTAALPRTSDGQIDTAALLADGDTGESPASMRVLASTEWEKRLATIWGELLRISEIDIHANFFELGGHSLLATQVISRIRSDFGSELSLRHLFETPNIAALAKMLEQAQQILIQAPIQRTRRQLIANSTLADSE